VGTEPLRSTRIRCPTPLVTRLVTGVQDRRVEVDHFTAEITLGTVTHLSCFNTEVIHVDVEFMEYTWSQPDEYFFDRLNPASQEYW